MYLTTGNVWKPTYGQQICIVMCSNILRLFKSGFCGFVNLIAKAALQVAIYKVVHRDSEFADENIKILKESMKQ